MSINEPSKNVCCLRYKIYVRLVCCWPPCWQGPPPHCNQLHGQLPPLSNCVDSPNDLWWTPKKPRHTDYVRKNRWANFKISRTTFEVNFVDHRWNEPVWIQILFVFVCFYVSGEIVECVAYRAPAHRPTTSPISTPDKRRKYGTHSPFAI